MKGSRRGLGEVII